MRNVPSISRMVVASLGMVLSVGTLTAGDPLDPAVIMRLSEDTPPAERSKNRPYYNGLKFQQSPNGRVWLVVNGKAMGYPNPQAFQSIHFADAQTKYPNPLNEDPATHQAPVPVAAIDFMEHGMWSDNVRLVRNKAGNIAIQHSEQGKPVLYSFPNSFLLNQYCIDTGKAILISDKEWASYPQVMVKHRENAR